MKKFTFSIRIVNHEDIPKSFSIPESFQNDVIFLVHYEVNIWDAFDYVERLMKGLKLDVFSISVTH